MDSIDQKKKGDKWLEMVLLLEKLDVKIKNNKYDGRNIISWITQAMFAYCDEKLFDKIIIDLKKLKL